MINDDNLFIERIIVLIVILTLLLPFVVSFVKGEKEYTKYISTNGINKSFFFSYPNSWNLLKNETDIDTIKIVPLKDSNQNNTFLQVDIRSTYGRSLKDLFFLDLNTNILKYVIREFHSFKVNDISSNFTIGNLPANMIEVYKRENDRYQSPVSVIDYFTVYDKNLIKITYSEDKDNINSYNKKLLENIIGSFRFK